MRMEAVISYAGLALLNLICCLIIGRCGAHWVRKSCISLQSKEWSRDHEGGREISDDKFFAAAIGSDPSISMIVTEAAQG